MCITDLLQHKLLSSYKKDITIDRDFEISGVTCDSRKVKPGYIFIAVKGFDVDGNQYIDKAVASGAVLIVTAEHAMSERIDIPLLVVKNDRLAYSLFSSAFYSQKPKNLVAVTGTNGKTSVVNFCKQIWNLIGEDALSVGTLGMLLNDSAFGQEAHNLTTPSSENLHLALEQMVDQNISNVAIEASSQGLHQHRLDGLSFKVAAFTNLSHDHLDYHQTMEDYLDAKMYLFEHLVEESGTVVLNADIDEYKIIKMRCEQKGLNIVSYGADGENIKILNTVPRHDGQVVAFEMNHVRYKILIPLVGLFQVYNVMATLGIMQVLGYNIDKIVGRLTRLKSVSGRMERVGKHPRKAAIYVDYAHTPDALEKAITSLRAHTESNIHVLFGCGGDRDHSKRIEMGQIAAKYADKIIVTDDNPRTESPEAIRQDIMRGCPEAETIGDRSKAIEYAVRQLQEGDILLIAGKGHEDYQIIGTQKISFDDRVKACEAISQMEEKV